MKAQPITVYLPDTRSVDVSRYGMGNDKIGFGVFTYSRTPGDPAKRDTESDMPRGYYGTCPGSTTECEAICYAKRIKGDVALVHRRNSVRSDVPPIPGECRILRIHVSGDFDSVEYIENWIVQLILRPDVTCWAYTRSWRVPALLPTLEKLRALPNVQLFASMDASHEDLPPTGWRRAWIDGDVRQNGQQGGDGSGSPWIVMDGSKSLKQTDHNRVCWDTTPSLVCPEETGRKANCLACGYCFEGKKNDVTFLRHDGK